MTVDAAGVLDTDPNAFLVFDFAELSSWIDGTDSTAFVDNVSVSSASVPEPSSIALLAAGLIGLGVARRR